MAGVYFEWRDLPDGGLLRLLRRSPGVARYWRTRAVQSEGLGYGGSIERGIARRVILRAREIMVELRCRAACN